MNSYVQPDKHTLNQYTFWEIWNLNLNKFPILNLKNSTLAPTKVDFGTIFMK